MAGTRSPSQDNAMICARRIQSAGACRAPASLRILRSSTASTGGRANNSFGMVDHHHGTNLGVPIQPHIEEPSTSRALLGWAGRGGAPAAQGLAAGVACAGPDAEQGLEFPEDGVERQAGAGTFGSRRNCVQNAWARAVSVT